MRIHLKNNDRTKFHPYRIWNDGALGLFVSGRPNNLEEQEEQDE